MTNPTQPEPPTLAAATAMFVEVLVVGIGALTAAVLLLIALIGPAPTAKLAPVAGSSAAAAVGLAAAYAVGILVDRAADSILTPHRRRLRTHYFPSNTAYAQARLRLADMPVLAARADYARSRMRICRGWTLNTLALALTADLATLRYSIEHRPFILGATSALGIATAFGFYRAWRTLTVTGYRKLAEQTTLPPAGQPVPAQPQPNPVSP
ncbi:hypothetical protein SHL15_9286 [Streptomyces hygroscopicus subsp. limoneus]|nr:hypothetical protein SHL15_0002 [Streptomyces hygroscopicus subsp. limoneus]ALO98665.1 hypothetical protein SHL15_7665 [Streptomyces hygroscopicus subsp. limoneus]ALO98666.1 hypothetical protein SHL15_7668 [Streptomyces hygroscopicus subsp. limoneus]ALP00202.1 hypothetical protein SHL15_9286 [Streptomyces hygroscopicus subsp. limoneus]